MLPAEFVGGFACDLGEDVQREDAPEASAIAAAASGESWSRSTIARDSQRTASWAFSHERRWLAVQARRLEERRGDVVDGGQPLVCAVVVCSAVELERTMTAVEDEARVLLRVVEQLVDEPGVAGRGQQVDHVDRDAEGRACGNGGRQHRDRPVYPMILIAFGQSLASSLRAAVVIGELLVRPAPCELVVVGAEISHRAFGEHDVNAAAP